MRSFLVVLILSWLGGIFLGGISLSPFVTLVIPLVVLFLVRRQQGSLHLAAAATALVLLGFLLASPVPDTTESCKMSEGSEGIITQYPRIYSTHVAYRVDFEPGCQALVKANRWPLLEREEKLVVTDGTFTPLVEIAEHSPGYASYLQRHNLKGIWNYTTVESLGSGRDAFSNVRSFVRHRLNQLFVEPTGSIVRAMLVGDRDGIPEDILTTVRSTGVAHVLAISGLHISLLTGLIILILQLSPLSPTQRTVLTLLLLWFYIVVIGAPASALRAGFFWSLALVSFRFALLSSLPTAVLLTATVILTVDPMFIREISFQLSFAAVVGIFSTLFITKPWHGKIPVPSGVQTAVLVSLGATLTTWPLISLHFGVVSPLSLLANLLVVPVVPLILGLAIVAVVVSFFSMPLALLFTWVVHLGVHYLITMSTFVERIPGAFFTEMTITWWGAVLYYASLVLAFHLLLRRQDRLWREIWV